MSELWLDITDLPASGREFSFSDPSIWTGPIEEFRLAHRVEGTQTPLEASVTLMREGRGVLIRGRISGVVVTPCDRCAEDAVVPLDSGFELFEELPLPGEEVMESGLLRQRGKVLELDVGALLWEQFLLAMPVKPLCAEDCRGLCPKCGANLNAGPCGCAEAEGDPRLAALKTLTVRRDPN